MKSLDSSLSGHLLKGTAITRNGADVVRVRRGKFYGSAWRIRRGEHCQILVRLGTWEDGGRQVNKE